jgi:hypothetical protein
LGLSGVSDRITRIVAEKIFEAADAQDFDPERLCNAAMIRLGRAERAEA